MKKQVKLNESQLKKIVAESVNMVLKEFNTRVEESNNDYFRGVKGVRMQYNGDTADPTLSYRNKKANY